MSEPVIVPTLSGESAPKGDSSYIGYARLIGALTLVSRVLGMARETVAAGCFGAGMVWSAFTVAFTIPNLFRKLLGEGALSAAFIPLYAQAVKNEHPKQANDFAAAGVNLLCVILLGLTVVGELGLWATIKIWSLRPDQMLAVKLTAIMLPYVLMVCGTAFLGGILQVHHRFGAISASPIALNLVLIVTILFAARRFDLSSDVGRERGVLWLSVSVLIAGVIQVLMLLPSLRAAGFRFRPGLGIWSPAIRRMLKLTVPVAAGAGVMQLSVLIDKLISQQLSRSPDAQAQFEMFGRLIRYPLAEGAVARLNWAQFLYQFPLGVFAIALATAIFPKLSAHAMDEDRGPFRDVLRRGIEGALFVGLPASVGLIVVRYPAVQLLFQHGQFTHQDSILVAQSTALYSAAIWAFSLQQILNRAYYALHDTFTPLVLAVVTLLVNTVVEVPLLWTKLAEAGMAAGTCISFALQALVMVWLLNRKTGGLHLSRSLGNITKMTLASAVMWMVCLGVQAAPFWPHRERQLIWAVQLVILMAIGGGTYFGLCALMGIQIRRQVGKD